MGPRDLRWECRAWSLGGTLAVWQSQADTLGAELLWEESPLKARLGCGVRELLR